jgi:DNA-binding transcriptional LysR family regulator
VIVEQLMKEVEAAARGDRRERLVADGAVAYRDPELFAAVDEVLRRAVERGEGAVLLPELLPDDEQWRLDTSLRFSSHRPVIGPAIVFVKQRLLLPLVRWLVDYNRDNFRRQQRVNRLLAACIEELALENARLRRELNRR